MQRLQSLSRFLGILAAAIGSLALLGWLLNIPILTNFGVGPTSLRVGAALCAVLSGTALGLANQNTLNGKSQHRTVFFVLPVLLAGSGALLSGLQVLQYTFGAVSEFGQFWMSFGAAIVFLLLSLAIGLSAQRLDGLAQSCALGGFLLSLVSLVGYFWRVEDFYQEGIFSGISFPAALMGLALAIGVLCLHPDRGWMAVITSPYAGGFVARRLLPVVLLIPILITGLFLGFYRGKTFDPEQGTLVRAAINMTIFGSVTWWSARQLNRVDRQRQLAEQELRQSYSQLEQRVAERTAELTATNASLMESRRQLASLIDTLPGIVIQRTYSEMRSVTYLSEGCLLRTGYGSGDLTGNSGRTYNDLIHPDDLPQVLATIDQAVTQQQTYSVEYRIYTNWDEEKWFWERGKAVLDQTNHIQRIEGFVSDITDRKRAEAKQHQSYNLLDAVINSSPDPIFVKDAQGHYLLANAASARVSGKSIEQILGKTDRDIFPPPLAEMLNAFDRRVMETGEPEVLEEDIPGEAGIKTILVTKSPWRDATGEIKGVVGVTKEITDRKQAEEKLRQSYNLFHAVIDGTADPIFVKNHEGRYVLVNSAAGVVFGRPATEVVGWNDRELLPIETAAVLMATDQRIMDSGRAETLEEAVPTPTGIQIYLSTKTPWRNGEGRVIGVIGVARNISDRKQAENSLRDNYNLLHSVIDGVPDPLFVKDQSGRYILANQAAANVLGRSIGEMIGRDDFDLFPPQYAALYQELDRAIMASGETRALEEEVAQNDHQIGTYLTTKTPWRNVDGKVIGLIGLTKNITDRKQTELQIQQLNETLEQRVRDRTAELTVANQELEAFSYSVSHDLRAPLRGIAGFSKVLGQRYADRIDEKGQHYLDRIQAGIARMNELIDDLLQLSRVTRSEMRRSQVNLSAIAQEIANSLSASEPDRSVEWRIAPDLIVNADERLMRVVLENLLSNAWKFTANCPNAQIELTSMMDCSETQPIYCVRDNGAGFEMAYADKLFKPFQRLHSTTEFSGTGVGLATVQRVIQRHQGRVWAIGTIDQGASFYFTL